MFGYTDDPLQGGLLDKKLFEQLARGMMFGEQNAMQWLVSKYAQN